MGAAKKNSSRISLLCLLLWSFNHGAVAQNSLVGTTNLEFNFAAAQSGLRPGFAQSLGGVASLTSFLDFLKTGDLERDFVPTNVRPPGLGSDAKLELTLPSAKLWVLNATLIGNLPVGARLEVEVEGTRWTNLSAQLETVIWWDRSERSQIRINFRLWLRHDVQPSTYSIAVQYALNELP
jgi:hypothetical protein